MDRLLPTLTSVRSRAYPLGVRPLIRLFILWYQRAVTRRRLQQLDARALADLGLNQVDQYREGGKPFWRE